MAACEQSGRALLWLMEPRMGGHHGGYIQWLVRGAVARGYDVLLVTDGAAAQHPVLLSLQAEFCGNLQVAYISFVPSEMDVGIRFPVLVVREYRYYQRFRAFYRANCREYPPAFVLLPYLDYCLYAIAMFGSPFGRTPWGGLAMRPAFHLPAMGVPAPYSWLSRVKQGLFLRLLREPALVALFTCDLLLETFIQQHQPGLAARCVYLPEPAELTLSPMRAEARRALGIAESAVVILAYGVMTCRKGVDILARLLQEPGCPDSIHVIVAGQQDAETRTVLAEYVKQPGAWGRLHILDRCLSAMEEGQVFASADTLWLGYRDHYVTSGVLVQAGQAGVPVIGCEAGVIGWLIQQHQLGITISLSDLRRTAESIWSFVLDPVRLAQCGQNGRRAFAGHRPDLFVSGIFDRLAGIGVR